MPRSIGWRMNSTVPFCLLDSPLAPMSACELAAAIGVFRLIALGLPVVAEGRHYSYRYLPSCGQPKLFISGDHDPYGPVAEVEAVVATTPEPKQMVWIQDADHFFVGKLDQVQAEIIRWVKHNFPAGGPSK